MSLSVETLAVARKYTDDSLAGAGAVAGVPCKIQSITAITGGNRVTFLWTDNNGDDHTSAMDVMNGVDGEDGKGIQSVSVNAQNHLIITYTDGTTVDAGQIEIHSSVDSVNGQTGAVVLDAEDVGALPDNTPIPSKTSDLTNDSGFATTSDVSTALADYTKTADLTTLLAAKQDTLTFDNAPTENSNNPVKSGGIYADEKAIYEVMGKMGAKNLIPYPHDAKTETKAGITFTENVDGSITVNGTATDIARHLVTSKQFKAGEKYILSGCPSGGAHSSNETYTLYTQTINNYDDGEGVEFTWDASITGIIIAVFAGITVDNLTFYPMIRLASDPDDTYVPYAMTNQELSSQMQTLTQQANAMVNVYGSKNLLKNQSVSKTINGVEFTRNPDGSITANGTATANVGYPIDTIGDWLVLGRDFIFTTGLDYNVDSANITVQYKVGSTNYWIKSGETIHLDNAPVNAPVVTWWVSSGKTVNNKTCYPMIRDARIADATYEPYAMTNQQITPYVQAISNPNLLDNPWFTVNQRGFSSKNDNGFTVDRWQILQAAGTVSLSNGAITIDPTVSGTTFLWGQTIENAHSKLAGKSVTLSVMLSDGTIKSKSFDYPTDSPSNRMINNVYLGSTHYFELYEYSSGHARVGYFNNGGVIPSAPLTIKAVKLELGSVSTLAMDTAPSYATELLKCQRYFLRISVKDASNWMLFCMVWANSAMNYILSTPVEMRSIPTVSVSNIANFIICKGASTNSRKTGTGINCFEKISTSLVGTIDVSETDLAIGDMYVIKAGSANDFIEFSADL